MPRFRNAAQARSSGRTLLTEYESKQLLAAYHIPIAETISPMMKTMPPEWKSWFP
jgi:acyl-CoA synthetase (NDP forming)